MSSWSEGLHPALRPYFELLVHLAHSVDATTRVTSAYRSSAEQSRLYRRWLAGVSQFPAAPPGRSYHEYGRAIDMVARPETLAWLGQVWASWGGQWGGKADPIHFQA